MGIPDIRQRSGYLFLAVAFGQLILISAQVNSRSGVPLLQALVFGAFADVQRGTAAVVGGVRGTWDGYFNLRRVGVENEALRQQVSELQVALQRQRALAGESEGLRKLLDLRDRAGLPTRAADVVGTSASADFRTITIDRGSRDGVSVDMAVVSSAGAVGRVVMPSRHASKVQLLTDRNAAVAVMVDGSRVQGIALGRGENLLSLEYVSASAEIKVGDRLVTSGIDGIYPSGFFVGAVEAIDRAGGTMKTISIRPAVDFNALEHVLVVLAPPTAAGPAVSPAAAPPAAPGKAVGERR
jgi:rod shape-determining protein MreC